MGVFKSELDMNPPKDNAEDYDLTFVVQGPIKILRNRNLTRESLFSIRKFFPNSCIILSTDEGSSLEGLSFDQVVFSKPPIPALIENDKSKHLMSANFQICSSKAGLRLVESKYAIKLRSDMVFTKNSLSELLAKTRTFERNSKFSITREPVIVLDWSTIYPRKALPILHHPSDHLYLGLSSDVKEIWDTPLYPTEYMRWFERNTMPQGARHGGNLQRFRAEEWIWLNYLKPHLTHQVENSYEYRLEAIDESLAFMVNNLVVISSKTLGVQENPFSRRVWRTKIKMMSHDEWCSFASKYGAKVEKLDNNVYDKVLKIVWWVLQKLSMQEFVFKKT